MNASNFNQLSVKFSIRLHTGQKNDCLFIELDPLVDQRKEQKTPTINLIKNKNIDENADVSDATKINLPLICSVSNDNWIKIYSLEDRSLFRSHNASNFSLSSVDCVQIKSNTQDQFDFANGDITSIGDLNINADSYDDEKRLKRSLSTDSYYKTLLFLSCWDNSMYIYDMNYNRCIHTLSNSHDDAISRVRIMNFKQDEKSTTKKSSSLSAYTLIVTSSWDSSIKIWRSPSLTNKQSNENRDFIRTEYLSELGHDSAVIDFQLSRNYLASICEDGNLYLWTINTKSTDNLSSKSGSNNGDSEEDETSSSNFESIFSYLYTIQSSSDIGKINDCKINESTTNGVSTLAVCTSFGFIKIFNIQTNAELFSLKVSQPSNPSLHANMNKLYYTPSFIITIDQSGYVYFIDLQQVNNNSNNTSGNSGASAVAGSDILGENSKLKNSSFLNHTIKLCSNSLQTLCIFKDMIVCVGDSDGNLYFLSLIDI